MSYATRSEQGGWPNPIGVCAAADPSLTAIIAAASPTITEALARL
jgi:hypothetical protein